ncbi:Uncharacterized protein FKW44_001187 [Caligus rogercresseyi]|uniref:Uncharacterized protein n=1 Tax=Caligus rogercresseyi TaxID=217165 RepID=A0A7T8KID3_CALRO|nr:Uncharacterized protein FKW44_001187 [Caligus rogercresseyi]
MQKRQRCSDLLDAGIKVARIIFTVYQVYHPMNDRWLGKQQNKLKGVVASDGTKMPPILFKAGRKSTRLSTTKLKANLSEGHYVWTQNGDPPNTSSKCQEFAPSPVIQMWPP